MPAPLHVSATIALALWTHPRWPVGEPRLLPDDPAVEERLFELLDLACLPDVRWQLVDAERPGIELIRGARRAFWSADRLTDALARALLARWDRQAEQAGDWPRAGAAGESFSAYLRRTAEALQARGVPLAVSLQQVPGRHGLSRWVAGLQEADWAHEERGFTEVGVAAAACRALLDRYALALRAVPEAQRLAA